MPLVRRIPKFGFTNPFRVDYTVINLKTLAHLEDVAESDTPSSCRCRPDQKEAPAGQDPWIG